MKTYIDFDGVIMDTETHLFDDFAEFKRLNPDAQDYDYVSKINWEEYLRKSKFIPGSLEYLDDNPDAIILTKVCSLAEASAKIKILREYSIFNSVVTVPYGLTKSEVVSTFDSMLVDDTLHNLDDWQASGGISVYFNKDNSIVDTRRRINDKYIMIDSLAYLKNNARKRNK